MKTIEIHGQLNQSKIVLDSGIRYQLKKYFPLQQAVVITDEHLIKYYHEIIPDVPCFIVGQGEVIKNLDTVHKIYQFFLKNGVNRHTFVLAIGGGIVCDIVGFVASTFMRGIPFGFLSTTLLSQVDASIGGKNGVNFDAYKNMIGTFTQPNTVLIDPKMLHTLPKREILCGLSEMIKHGMIRDKAYLQQLAQDREEILALNPQVLEDMIYRSLQIKSEVVTTDERERGERKKLNFGHTVGHAIEKLTRQYNHGEAVALGMVFAIELSIKRGYLTETTGAYLKKILYDYQLPNQLTFDREALFEAISHDKKRDDQDIDFILLKEIGEAVIEPISLKELQRVLDALC